MKPAGVKGAALRRPRSSCADELTTELGAASEYSPRRPQAIRTRRSVIPSRCATRTPEASVCQFPGVDRNEGVDEVEGPVLINDSEEDVHANIAIELFSSAGGVPILFDKSGRRFPFPLIRIKPGASSARSSCDRT